MKITLPFGLGKVHLFRPNEHPTIVESSLRLIGVDKDGKQDDKGIVSRKMITRTAADQFARMFSNSQSIQFVDTSLRYLMLVQGVGTGTNAEAVTDTNLQTPLYLDGGSSETLTAYDSDNVSRGTAYVMYSTLSSGGTGVIISETTFQNTTGSSKNITEHGEYLMDSETSYVMLLDRHTFSAYSVPNNDYIKFIYTLTFTSAA